MNIKDHWGRLDPATQKWLVENPDAKYFRGLSQL